MVMDSKKGQQMTLGTIIMIILGIFVLIFLIVGFTQGWNIFQRGVNVLEGDLEVAVQACDTFADADLNFNYCEFKEYELEGKEGFYNCVYVKEVADRTIENGAGFSERNCGTDGENGAKNYCINLKDNNANDWENTVVNGRKCGMTPQNGIADDYWNVDESSIILSNN